MDLFIYERIIFGPYTVVNMIVNFEYSEKNRKKKKSLTPWFVSSYNE